MKKFSLAFLLFVCASIGIAQVITPFTIRYQTTQKGGIRYISNTAVSCNGGGGCNTARAENPPAGTGTDNGFTAAYVDIDGDASTFQSSSDSLDLASCSEILWAGLYWGAENQSGGSNYANRNQCKIKVNSGAYTNLTADAFQDNAIGFNTYHCFKDITALVQGAGIKSRFTVANVAARVGGTNRFGGWSIVVVYKNDLQPMRNLTVFNGLSNVSGANPTTDVTVSGFLTPLSGPITFEIGNITYDGDRSSTGDQLQFNGGSGFVNISDADNNANDIFNSTLCYNGVAKTAPFINPGYLNTLGYDADIFIPNNVAKNYIGNSATSATLRLTTGGETFLTQVVSMAIDVYEPDLRASIRVTDINGGTANPGDILEYRVKGINIGSDPSVNSFITDTIERNANYIPNSIRIIHGPNLGLKTDVVGDDQAEYTAGNRLIKVRIGTGATAATGGTVINSPTGADSTIFTYSVMVTNSCTKVACDNVIDARAYILGTGAVSTNTFSNGSNPGIFDAFGCPIPGTTSTPITATACATPTAGASSPGVCAGANFTLSASSDLEVTYLWSGPNSFTSVDQNPVLGPSTSSMSGVYSVTLIAYPGCSRTATTSVNINALPTLTTSASSTLFCSGVTSTLTASGAATYTWNPGALIGASVAVTPTATTIYTVTATNASGCSNTGTINLTVNAIPTLTATTSSSAICVGGTATLTSSGANTYTWNPGASTGTTVVVTPTATTVYTVTGTNASGCTNTSTVSLTVNSLPTLTATASSSAICIGGTATLTSSGATTYTWNPSASTGTAVVVTPTATTVYTVTGTNSSGCINSETVNLTVNTLPTAGITNSTGTTTLNCTTTAINVIATGGTSYTWSGGLGSLATATITNPGTYTVTATGANGCSSQSVISVSQNTTAPTAGITNSTGTTTLNCTTTSINVTATGGTSYTWSGGLGSTATATITNPGTYTVTATGANGCSSQSVITVSQNTTAPTAGITNSTGTTTLNCTTTSINVTATGGTSYTWSGGLGSTATATITNLGTYTVTATGANGCSSQSVITVSQNTTAPSAGITNSTGTTTLNCTTTSINVTATGGTSYTWSGGLGSLATATITNPGTYTVTATGANGCSSQSVIAVSQNTTAPTAGITNSTGTTTLNCTTTSINVTATGGTSYTWSGGLGSLATATITNPGTYTVTATGANGCSSQSVITVSQNTTAPTAGITNSTGTTTLNCIITSINVTATGGTSYIWTGGLGSLATATITNPGTYTVTATGANGCSSQSVITVSQNTTAPTVGITNSTGTTTLNCTTTSINVTATGGTSYTWSGGIGSLATATITNPGTYTVTATGANGCSSQSVIAVTQNTTAPIVIASSSPSSICAGSSVTLTASGATSYTWNPGNFSGSTLTVSPTSTTIYTLTGLAANGCTNTTTLNLTVNSIPILTLTASSTTVCSGGTITLTALGASTYTWDPVSLTGPSITSTITSTTVYSVTGESSEGCIGSSSITVSLNNCPTAVNDATNTIENTPVTGNAAANDSETIGGTFTSGTPSAGTGTLTMDPATGQYTFTPSAGFAGVSSTSYTLCNGSPIVCSSAVITVTVFPTLLANPDAVTTTPSVSTSGTLTTNDNGVVPGATYSVSVTQLPPSTGTITIDPATGQYTFTPNPTYTGSTTTTYTICNTSVNPIVCSSTTISILVGNVPVAVADATTTIENTPVSGDASSNDSGAIPTLNPVFTSGPLTAGTGTLTMDPATGQYTYTPATGFTGTTTATYTLCNLSSPPCSTTTIIFTVFPTLVANPDVINTTPSVTVTGTLTTNDGGVVPSGTYSVTVTQPTSTTGTITVDPATGGYTFTPNPTFTGTTTTTYTLCNTSVNPIVCSTTTITINVFPNPAPIDDSNTTIENTPVSGNAGTNDGGTTGGTFTTGQPTVGTGTITMDPATGQYTYTPSTGFTGTTSATYTLCNGAPTTCSTAVITVTVFPTLVANPDVITTTPSVSTTGTLTTNDNGVIPGGTYSVSVTQPPSSTGTITIDPATGQYTFTPNPTFTGTTTTTYTICNTSVNPIVCSSTTISILVGNVPVAVADATTTIENTPVSGDASSNDSGAIPTLNPVFTSGPLTAGTGTLTMDPATGQYTYTPATGFTGTTTATYTLCNLSSPPCSTTTIIFTVFPTLVANPDVIVTTPSVSTSGTLTTNDNGVVPGATYSVSVTQLPSSTGTITIDPATGQYTFTPNPTYTGSTTTTYTICNTSVNPIVCSSTTISILVGNVPVAVADATTTIENTPVSGDASSNDSGAIPTLNPVFTSGPLTAGTGTLTMDPATGQYTYTPATGFTGTTSATYTLCNLSSPPCSTTTITFTVFPTLVANPDVITTTPSVTVTGTLTTNDGGVVPGGTYSVTVTQPTSTTGTITVDPATGGYTFTPNPTFTGTTTTTYTLCNTSVNPIVCSTTTITIIVGTPKIAVAKTVVSTIKTNATTYQSVFSFNLANLGNTIGTNVQLVDNLNNTFPAPITYTVVGVTANSPLTSNAAYDGNTTVAMLSGTNSLNPLQNSIVTLTVNFSPNSTTLTTLSNSGVGSTANNPDPTGTGPHTSSDTTDAGTSPDPDGDGIPNEPGENDPTTFGQQIAASKTASTLTKVNATTFQTVFTFNVANVGPVTATNVQLTDNLNNTFLAPMTYTVVGLNANTPLTANGAYDGSTNIALLSGSNSLVSGANALVTLTVNFNTNSSTATTISNIGIASTATNPDPSGTGPHVSIDTTGTGTNPDPDDDGVPNEPGENDPTTFGQQIGAAKTSSGFSKLNATTFQTVFTFNVANYGAVAATNVQLTDDLNSTFPAPMTFTVVGLNANTPLTANAGYNGSSNIAMLSGTNTLNTSQSALVTLTVNFSPNTTTLTSLSNIGVASTSNLPDPTGGGTHTSTDTTGAGTDPDPDGDGNPNEPEENNPTFFGQQVAGAKTASTLIKVNATTYQTVFTFNIANVGPVTATNVQLTDNLNNTFLAPMTYTVVGLNANSPLTTNAGYNGNTNIALLSGNNTLNASQSSIVTLTVNFSPNSSTVTLLSNIGIVSSSDAPDPTGGGTHTSTDTTGAGTNPDPDGDGNPNEPGENDPITFGQQIGVSKNALSTVKLENGDNQTTFVFTLQNLGVVSATNVQLVDNLNNTFPSPITYNVVSVTSSSGLSTNTLYDGGTDINLLTGTNTLSVGSIQTVTLVVNFNMNGSSLSSLYNYGIATSSSSNGTIISSDTTNVGNNPDTDDDGNPNEPGDNIPTEFSPVKENPDEPESFNIPQGFSPNGDGVNDVFVIRGISIYPNNKLTIINRWGNVVFEKDNYDNTWDGKSTQGIRFGGDELPDGTYFYILDLGNNEKPYKGFIYISKTIK
jgi:gliding motility-associated-like protein